MDIIFAVATTKTEVYVEEENITLLSGTKRIFVPVVHDRISGMDELKDFRKTLHERLDAILDESQNL